MSIWKLHCRRLLNCFIFIHVISDKVFREIIFYLVIWLRITVPFWIIFHHLNYIWKYSCIKLDKNLEILKQIYYPIIKFYLLIQIYFFGLRPKCSLKPPVVHYPKNDGTEKHAFIESEFKVSYWTLLIKYLLQYCSCNCYRVNIVTYCKRS